MSEQCHRTEDNYVAISAWGDWHHNVPKGMVLVLATKGGIRENPRKWFLIPADEYKMNFVIDPTRYASSESINNVIVLQ